jgi:hypothetical protein
MSTLLSHQYALCLRQLASQGTQKGTLSLARMSKSLDETDGRWNATDRPRPTRQGSVQFSSNPIAAAAKSDGSPARNPTRPSGPELGGEEEDDEEDEEVTGDMAKLTEGEEEEEEEEEQALVSSGEEDEDDYDDGPLVWGAQPNSAPARLGAGSSRPPTQVGRGTQKTHTILFHLLI